MIKQRPTPHFSGRMPQALLACLLALCLLSGCLGPKPVVVSTQSIPPTPGSGQPFQVDALVTNTGPGEGQVLVVVRLVDKQTQQTLAGDDKNVQLRNGETQHVLFSLDLPPSSKDTPASDIDVKVEAIYPN